MSQKQLIHVAIIGAGQLGSRHLQAMALTDIPLSLEIVDPNQEALNMAEQRYKEMPTNPLIEDITFHQNINDLYKMLDIVIVATTSKPRRSVIEQLLAQKRVKYLILEKVLFPKLNDYDEIQKLLLKDKVKAWVNCGRRMTSFYRNLKKIFQSEKSLVMAVSGTDWGLACNSIHFLDIYSFLSNQGQFESDIEQLDDSWIDSKRKGYIEFTGSLRIKSLKGSLLLTSYQSIGGGLRPVIISLQSENFYCVVNESAKVAKLFHLKENTWQWENLTVDIKYQSQTTQDIIKQIIQTSECYLPNYSQSAKLHKILLEGFLRHCNIFRKESSEICPIT